MNIDPAFVQSLMKAVQEKSLLQFPYQGLERQVCPYLLGKTKDDRLVLQGFQFGGQTSKGEILAPEFGGWRFFYLDEMPGAMVLGPGPWYPAPVQKAEGRPAYVPPKFITVVLALTPDVQ